MYRVWNFIANYSVLLVGGALIAIVWANLDIDSYRHFIQHPLWFNGWIGTDLHVWDAAYGPDAVRFETGDVERVLTVVPVANEHQRAAHDRRGDDDGTQRGHQRETPTARFSRCHIEVVRADHVVDVALDAQVDPAPRTHCPASLIIGFLSTVRPATCH